MQVKRGSGTEYYCVPIFSLAELRTTCLAEQEMASLSHHLRKVLLQRKHLFLVLLYSLISLTILMFIIFSLLHLIISPIMTYSILHCILRFILKIVSLYPVFWVPFLGTIWVPKGTIAVYTLIKLCFLEAMCFWKNIKMLCYCIHYRLSLECIDSVLFSHQFLEHFTYC